MKKILFLSLFTGLSLAQFAQTTSTNPPAVTENRPPCSCYPGEYYTNVQNAAASDDQCVGAVLELRPDCQNDSCFYTRYFYAHNFGFVIPLSASITGITVNVERSAGIAGIVADSVVRMVPMNWAVVGNNYALPNVYGTTDSTVTYGSSTDLWGYPFTVNEVSSPDFGIAIIIKNNSTTLSPTACIDFMQMTIDYSLATGENFTQTSSPYGFSILQDANSLLISMGSIIPSEQTTVSITDISGKLILEHKVGSGAASVELSTDQLSSGIYVVRLGDSNYSESRKIRIAK